MSAMMQGGNATAVPRSAARFFELGVATLPRRLRRERGRDMQELFEDLFQEAAGRSRLSATRFTITATLRAVAAGLRARLTSGGAGPELPRGGSLGSGWMKDIGYALRGVRRDPGFAIVVVLTLALAIGVNSTIFSLGRTMIFIPIPFADQATLVGLRADNPEQNLFRSGLSAPDLVDLADRVEAFEGIATAGRGLASLDAPDGLTRVGTLLVAPDFFELTGLPLLAGRSFRPEEHENETDVVLLSHSSWQRRFGGEPMLGESISVGGTQRIVVGIVDPQVERSYFGGAEIWQPMRLDASGDRTARALFAFARLAPGANLEEAAAETVSTAAGLAEEHPLTNDGWRITAISLQAALIGTNALTALALMGMAVLFVLLIACVNVANLMMARGASRDREIAVRMAMGAGRARVVRQLLIEGALLASLAAAGGLLIARGTFLWLVAVTRGRGDLFLELKIDPGVAAFALTLGLATPLVFALVPALRGSRADLHERLGEGSRGHSAGRGQTRLRGALIAGQVALALTLLIVSSLATRSVIALVGIEPGFDPGSTLTMRLDARGTDTSIEDDDVRALHREIRAGVAGVPRVAAAALVSRRPFVGGDERVTFRVSGHPEPAEADVPRATLTRVTADYLEVTRIPLDLGRPITAEDVDNALPVAVVSRAARERYWDGTDPVGDTIVINGGAWPELRVVGVIGDLRNPDADQPSEPAIIVSLDQFPLAHVSLMARTRDEPEDARDAIVAAVRTAAPTMPVEDTRTMEQVLHDDLSGDMAIISLLGFFALVALGLAVAGIYSVIAYTVSGRLREIGIRLALGARAIDVRRMVLRQGLLPVAIGLTLGLAAGSAISRLIAGALYGVTPTDPTTFLGTPALFLAVSALACLVPARRAARVDPADSLRDE